MFRPFSHHSTPFSEQLSKNISHPNNHRIDKYRRCFCFYCYCYYCVYMCVCVYFVQFQAKGLKEHFTPFHYILIKKYNTLYTKRIFSYKIKRDTPSLRTHTHDRFTYTKWSFFFRTHHTHTNSHICVIPIYFHIYTIDIWYILLIRVCRDE